MALKIEDLTVEAINSLYELHRTTVSQLYGPAGLGAGKPGAWGPMATEQHNVLDAAKRNKGAAKYGVTFDRVRWTWEHVEMAPASLTDLGAEELNQEHPHPCPKCVREGKAATCQSHVFKRGEREYASYAVRGTLQELQQQWIDLYTTKVREVLNGVVEKEGRAYLAALTDRLTVLEIGTAEGAEVTARLRREVKGREALRLLLECRQSLLQRLCEIVPTSTPANAITATNGHAPQTEQPAPTFLSLLGGANLETALTAIRDLGFRSTPTKGKGQIVAAMEAALEHFEAKVPAMKYWPAMLNEQFDGINASAKAVPPAKAAQRTQTYRDARAAMLDRLKR